MAGRWLPHARAIAWYALVALAFAWPLPAHLSTHLTGPLDSDAAVYVWNQWVFHHELVENRSLPYFTGTIFSLTPKANLSLHNYTTFANLLALPLIPPLGIVASFNVVLLVLRVITAYAMFLLAREATDRSDAESWLAGLLFAWCPVLITRGTGHYSLVAAAALPIFVLLLMRTRASWTTLDGIRLGLVMAWAALSDAYYGVFCLLIAAVVMTGSNLRVRRASPSAQSAVLARTLDMLIVLLLGLSASILISRGWQVTFMGRAIGFHTLYTPMLLLSALVLARLAIHYRPALPRPAWPIVLRFARIGMITAVVCAVVLSPALYAVGRRIADGRWYGSSPTYWRSSPPGVDLVALVLPNPNHPLAPETIREWLSTLPGGYIENVASIPFVVLGVCGLAWRRGWRPPRMWVAVAGAFAALALGPFVHVGTLNMQVPGPWAFLRYVPLIGLARSPARFTVVLMLALAAIFAIALRWLTREYPHHRRRLLALATLLLVLELLPIPRPLHAADVPPLYRRIAADPRPDVRVLELPFGVRDGTRSVGNFTARSQFFQTFHKKLLIGGYLSRVSHRRVDEIRRSRTLDALIALSEGGTLSDAALRDLEERAARFVARARVAYVVIDHHRASPELVRVAIRVFSLEPLERNGPLELYRPGGPSALDPGR